MPKRTKRAPELDRNMFRCHQFGPCRPVGHCLKVERQETSQSPQTEVSILVINHRRNATTRTSGRDSSRRLDSCFRTSGHSEASIGARRRKFAGQTKSAFVPRPNLGKISGLAAMARTRSKSPPLRASFAAVAPAAVTKPSNLSLRGRRRPEKSMTSGPRCADFRVAGEEGPKFAERWREAQNWAPGVGHDGIWDGRELGPCAVIHIVVVIVVPVGGRVGRRS